MHTLYHLSISFYWRQKKSFSSAVGVNMVCGSTKYWFKYQTNINSHINQIMIKIFQLCGRGEHGLRFRSASCCVGCPGESRHPDTNPCWSRLTSKLEPNIDSNINQILIQISAKYQFKYQPNIDTNINQAVALGDSSIVLAGGMESMSK